MYIYICVYIYIYIHKWYVCIFIYRYIYVHIYVWLSAIGAGQHSKKDLSATWRGELWSFLKVVLVGMEEVQIP